jgi:hypothetical protein
MIGFTGTSITITINYDSSQSMTVKDSLHSLLDHERLLFQCDEWRRIPAHILNSLMNESMTALNSWINSLLWLREGRIVATTSNSYLSFCLLSRERAYRTVAYQWTRSLLFDGAGTWLQNRCSAMDVRSGSTIPAVRRSLPNRCLAMVIFVTVI